MTDYPEKMARAFVKAFGDNHDLKTDPTEYQIWIDYMKSALSAVDPGLLDGTAIVVPATSNEAEMFAAGMRYAREQQAKGGR